MADSRVDVETLIGRRNADRWNRAAVGDKLERCAVSEPHKTGLVATPEAVADERFARVTYPRATPVSGTPMRSWAALPLGSSPIWYATQLLPLSVGLRRTKEILMLGEAMTAAQAQQIGWINKVVPAAELDQATQARCERLLAASPEALRLTKISLEFQADMLTPSVRHGFEALTYIYGTEEFHEGTAAYLEKRPPRFNR